MTQGYCTNFVHIRFKFWNEQQEERGLMALPSLLAEGMQIYLDLGDRSSSWYTGGNGSPWYVLGVVPGS